MARRPLNMREFVLAVFLALLVASSTVGQDLGYRQLEQSRYGLRAEQEAAPRRTISLTTAVRLKCFRRQTTNQGSTRLC
jgi:hypothetical protein